MLYIRLNNEKEYSKKRVITKISKLDENNQYGFGMIKPLPTGYIKQNLDTSCRNFNFLLQNVSLNDQIGHLYVVDIEFDHTKAAEKKKFIMKFIHQLLKNKRLLIHVKGQSISCSNNISQQKKEIQEHIEQLKKLMQRYSKKSSTNVFRTTFFAINRAGCSVTFTYIQTIHLNKSASKKSLF